MTGPVVMVPGANYAHPTMQLPDSYEGRRVLNSLVALELAMSRLARESCADCELRTYLILRPGAGGGWWLRCWGVYRSEELVATLHPGGETGTRWMMGVRLAHHVEEGIRAQAPAATVAG